MEVFHGTKECHLPYGITVLPATPHKWTHPALTPAMQAGTRFNYPGGIEGWVDLVDDTSFIPISARTDVYKYSLFPRTCTLLDWNTLSAEVRLKYSLSASESADLVD